MSAKPIARFYAAKLQKYFDMSKKKCFLDDFFVLETALCTYCLVFRKIGQSFSLVFYR